MADYTTPGVYVEEVPARNKPIEGVSTSTAAFVGLAPGGPLNRPVQITNWSQFKRIFSDPSDPEQPFLAGAYLAHAVNGFFANGGGECWVVRIGGEGRPRAELPAAGKTPTSSSANGSSDGSTCALNASTREGVQDEVKLDLQYDPPRAEAEDDEQEQDEAQEGEDEQAKAKPAPPEDPPPTYTLVVSAGTAHEKYTQLTATDLSNVVKESSKLVELEPPQGAANPQPKPGTYILSAPSKQSGEVKAWEFEGNVTRREGLGGLAAIEDISMVCVPDAVAIAAGNRKTLMNLQGKVVEHCESMGDRMTLLDTPADLTPIQALEWLEDANLDCKQATAYYPWLEVEDPLSGFPTLVPPCGHVAGIWARTDTTRGVHKAPANEAILGITDLAYQTTGTEQGKLNSAGLNCIRSFPGRGIRVWGARTLSSDPEWRYVNVRRLFNYISDSIMQGTQWAVFEPNDEHLWIRLEIAVGNFLTIVWRNGALFGGTPDKAFYVKCNAETNPSQLIDAGVVTTEIGIAPVKPAEFVVFRISQYSAGEDPSA